MTFATGDVDRVRPARELLIFGLVLGLCPLVALIEPGDPSTAVDRAVDMLAVERAIGLDVEQGIHHWVVARPAVAFIADLLYIALHMSALVGVLLWAASRRPEVYLGLRNLFVVSHLVSVAIYLAWPTAPPRLVAPSRDGPDTDGVLHHLQYEYAAVPSGHVVFAVVVAVGLQAAPTAFWRRAGLAYPPFVTLLVVATGHHLFLDAVVAVAVVGAAAGCISVAATVQVGEHLGAARSEVGTALRIGSIRARPRTASRRSPAGSS